MFKSFKCYIYDIINCNIFPSSGGEGRTREERKDGGTPDQRHEGTPRRDPARAARGRRNQTVGLSIHHRVCIMGILYLCFVNCLSYL